jgi:hypothetical protein
MRRDDFYFEEYWRPRPDLLAAIHEVYPEFDRCQYRELVDWDPDEVDELAQMFRPRPIDRLARRGGNLAWL